MTRFLQYEAAFNSGKRQKIILQIPQIAEIYDCDETTIVVMTNGTEHTLNTKFKCLMDEIAIGETILRLNKETSQ